MGILGFPTPRKMAEIKTTLVGKYVFDNLNNELRDLVTKKANLIFIESTQSNIDPVKELENLVMSNGRSVNKLHEKVRYTFIGLALAELGIEADLQDFKWFYVRNPFNLEFYNEGLWELVTEMLWKQYHIDVNIYDSKSFEKVKDNNQDTQEDNELELNIIDLLEKAEETLPFKRLSSTQKPFIQENKKIIRFPLKYQKKEDG